MWNGVKRRPSLPNRLPWEFAATYDKLQKGENWMNLMGKKVMLRAMELEDMETLLEMVNDPEIDHMVTGWSYPVSRHEQMRWFDRVSSDRNNLRFMIEELETGRAVGMISLTELDWKNREAVYGIKLRKSAPKRKGIATDAEFTLMRFVFEELNLHRLTSIVLDYNQASIVMTEKCGAKREGIKRSAIFKRGQYHDAIYYGELYEDFLEPPKKAVGLEEDPCTPKY